jgi:hypothetical protein
MPETHAHINAAKQNVMNIEQAGQEAQIRGLSGPIRRKRTGRGGDRRSSCCRKAPGVVAPPRVASGRRELDIGRWGHCTSRQVGQTVRISTCRCTRRAVTQGSHPPSSTCVSVLVREEELAALQSHAGRFAYLYMYSYE